jgi:hypothetical protein
LANVYSVRLYKGDLLSAGTFSTTAITSGHVFSVREILATWSPSTTNFLPTAAQGVKLETTSSGIIWRTPSGFTYRGRTYQGDIRYVLSAGEQLNIVTAEAGWSVYIDGFLLTLP